MGFLDSKVKSKINKTLLWLYSLESQDNFAGHKVKNQQNKDTFRRSIEKKKL